MHSQIQYVPGEEIIFTPEARKKLFGIPGTNGQKFRIMFTQPSVSGSSPQSLSIEIGHPKGIFFCCACEFVKRP